MPEEEPFPFQEQPPVSSKHGHKQVSAFRSGRETATLALRQLGSLLGNDCSGVASVDGQELTTGPTRPSAHSPAVEKRPCAAPCDGEVGEAALTEIVQAWPRLPQNVKVAVLAIIPAVNHDILNSIDEFSTGECRVPAG